MDKTYDPKSVESNIYQMWESGGYFTPKIDKNKKPFTILLPLPNANDPMHMGHALFTVQDILIRWHRMMGEPTLWLPGGDHAGIETQYVFEKKLAREDKSRFDFDRDTLYRMIEAFVSENKNINLNQMKQLGFSLDWSRYHYSLEPEIVDIVMETFKKLYDDKLIYRAERMVNYCTKCGTAFSDLEINHVEKTDLLYFLDYGIIQIATARPETIFADVAVAVNPKDKKYKQMVGKTAQIPLINKQIPIIADEGIDIKFGTGALKVTPAHDNLDYEIGKRHGLALINTINRSGRMINVPEKYKGLKIVKAREMVSADLKAGKKLVKTEDLTHTISVCYRCKTNIEPLLMPQWFVKTKPLAKNAVKAVKEGKTKIEPLPRFEKMYFDWLNNITDWNISRQIVWGPRLPVWYNIKGFEREIWVSFIDKNGQLQLGSFAAHYQNNYEFNDITKGLQQLIVPIYTENQDQPRIYIGQSKPNGDFWIRETDTFDTWFLSGQWPFTTLMSRSNSKLQTPNPNQTTNSNIQNNEIIEQYDSDFSYFYPTTVLDTMWDILFFWVGRMMMLSIYRTGQVPFETVHLHSRVVDAHGQKMAKSRGNVINPIDMVDKYGADALRFALIFGAAPGGDISISDDKVRGMRNFANKLWNIGRLIKINLDKLNLKTPFPFYDDSSHKSLKNSNDKRIISEVNMLVSQVTQDLKRYRFSDASQKIYEFTWHRLADVHLEKNKDRLINGDIQALSVVLHVYCQIIKLLHPFMPFVTEEIWGKLPKKTDLPLIISSWPKNK